MQKVEEARNFLEVELKSQLDDIATILKYKNYFLVDRNATLLILFKKEQRGLKDHMDNIIESLAKIRNNQNNIEQLSKELEMELEIAKNSISNDWRHFTKLFKPFKSRIKEVLPYIDHSKEDKYKINIKYNKIKLCYKLCQALKVIMSSAQNLELKIKKTDSVFEKLLNPFDRSSILDVVNSNPDLKENLDSYRNLFITNRNDYNRYNKLFQERPNLYKDNLDESEINLRNSFSEISKLFNKVLQSIKANEIKKTN